MEQMCIYLRLNIMLLPNVVLFISKTDFNLIQLETDKQTLLLNTDKIKLQFERNPPFPL